MKRALLAVAAGCLVVLTGVPVQAHTGSYDLKYVDGANVVLLTFNTHEPVSRLEIEHNIRLYDMVGAPIPYDEVRLEVHDREDDRQRLGPIPVHEATLPMLPTNESRASFGYPVAGSYSLAVTFFDDGRRISRGEFAVVVGPGPADSSTGFGVWPMAGAFGLGALVTVPLWRRGRSGPRAGARSVQRSRQQDQEQWSAADARPRVPSAVE